MSQPISAGHPQQLLKFTDAASCALWIDSLPLTNVEQTQQVLIDQLSALCVAQLPPVEHLGILEILKEPIAFVQDEAAKRYAGKPLPLDSKESAQWDSAIELWEEASRNYQQCLNAYREGDLSIAPYAALLCLRCLRHLGYILADYYRVYRQVPGALWHALHELYSFAEQHGLARTRVEDSFTQRDPETSCAESYVETLLAHLANPYSLSIRQMSFVHRWLAKWATLVGLSPQPLPPSAIPSLAVDLGRSTALIFAGDLEPQPNLRYLDLEQLSKTLRQTINLLKQGQKPEQLGLGADAGQPGCENLLMLLYVQWCRAGTSRIEERITVEESAGVCFGISAVHLHLSGGRPFRQPGELTSREKQDLDTFGYITRVEHASGAKDDSTLQTWWLDNRSPSGFMCMLREPGNLGQINHNQLLAVRPAGGKDFRLGMVQWLRINETNELSCGVRLFPGAPVAVAVRPSNFDPASGSRYERAILLPEVAAPATPATLVLPTGWFQSGRFVEVFSNRKQVAKLLNLLEKCGDFDRCTVTLV